MSGRLFIISGPAGVGKGTAVELLRQRRPDIGLSVSATTRPPRPGEVDGQSYYFMTDKQFDDLVARDGFLEWAQVHAHRYGTPREQVAEKLKDNSLILEIDPQGALNVRRSMPDAVLIFIAPPSMDELRRRLVGRGTEDAADIERRMNDALKELAVKDSYDEIVVNDDIDKTVDELIAIIDRYESR